MKRTTSALLAAGMFGLLVCTSPARAVDEIVLDTDIQYDDLKKHLLTRYDSLIKRIAQGEEAGLMAMTPAGVDTDNGTDLTPWWQPSVIASVAGLQYSTEGSLEDMFGRALHHSSQIKVFSDLPLIRRTTIQEADGVYDTMVFADGYLSETDEPVGDTLKTGGPDRYEEEDRGVSFGVRRKFLPGTEVEIEQQFKRFDNNSEYLDPHDQARTRTGISLTQPLLKGFGPAYNSAAEDLAEIDSASSEKEFNRQVSGHLLEVARAYWGLYMERSMYLQKQRLAEKAAELFNKMQERVSIDVQPSLLSRARSVMQSSKLDADEARFAILNAQSRIWALVNDPAMINASGIEYVTRQLPRHNLPRESMQEILETALRNRVEIDQSILQLKSAAVRHYKSKNELFPELDLYASAYTSGLKGEYDEGAAFEQQWDEGDPSYTVGLRFEFPLSNNSARARLNRKKIEIRQLLNQLDTTVAHVLLEAQVSYREMVKNHMAMSRRFEVMKSSETEIDDLINRIDITLSKNGDYGVILYQLLDAMARLNDAEQQFSASELTYNYSLYQLKSAKGVLLKENGVSFEEKEEDELPLISLAIGKATSPTPENRNGN